jgi:hypothetical protein
VFSHLHRPQALHSFSRNDLEAAIQDALNFHVRGGNIKSIQLFKDNAIDPTLEKLDIQFIPTNGKPTKEVVRHLRGYYDTHFDNRGGYGRPLPGKWSNINHKMLWQKRWFDVTEPSVGRDKWDASLGPIGPKCNLMQLGPNSTSQGIDGTKFLCQELTVPSNEECHIVSIGGNDNWKFEKAARERLGCVTHTFDCTLPSGMPRRKPKDEDVRFYNYCIDGKSYNDTHGRQYLSYKDVLKQANLKKPPKLLKLDVEGFEYDIFASMIQITNQALPQQIAVELHSATRMTDIPWMPRSRTAAEITMLMSMMFSAGGYLPVYVDFSPGCASCMEVLFFRAVC